MGSAKPKPDPELAEGPPADGDMQDGILAYYRQQSMLTDFYASLKNETEPFDYRDLMRVPKKSKAAK